MLSLGFNTKHQPLNGALSDVTRRVANAPARLKVPGFAGRNAPRQGNVRGPVSVAAGFGHRTQEAGLSPSRLGGVNVGMRTPLVFKMGSDAVAFCGDQPEFVDTGDPRSVFCHPASTFSCPQFLRPNQPCASRRFLHSSFRILHWPLPCSSRESGLAFKSGWQNLVNVLPDESPQTMLAMRWSGSALPEGGNVTVVNPLEMAGWDDQIAAFPLATVFHGTAWLRVLQETYGHTPLYLCQFAGGRLAACLPLAEVRSPLTGRRGVSLPFTDACSALLKADYPGRVLWDAALSLGREKHWKYLECRGDELVPAGTAPSVEFCSHTLDLRPGETVLESRLNSSVQRALRKGRAAGVRVEIASDAAAMAPYYRLHCLTRKRHGLPPQPARFFDNIARHLLAPRQGIVVLAHYDGKPVAGAVFLHFGAQAIYKFGASDAAAQHLRPNNLVMWEAMRYYAVREFKSLHFGRTSVANEGLRRFKCSFGAREQVFACFRYDFARARFVSTKDRSDTTLNTLFRRLPLPLLRLAGRLLYPHLS